MSNITVGNEKNILFYSDENGQIKVEVILQDEKCLVKCKCNSYSF